MSSDTRFKPLVALLMLVPVLGLLTSCRASEMVQTEVSIGGNILIVEVADTEELRSQGLMNRKKLDNRKGMLFVFESENQVSFWMKDTLIPLSIAFIASDGTIRQIEDMEPGSLAPIQSERNVLYALEVNRGWFAEQGVKPGDRVELPETVRRR